MTLIEIKKKYKDKWVLIQVTKSEPETFNIKEGKVLFHFANKDVVNEYFLNYGPNNCAIRFMGEIPKDWAAVL